MNVSGKFFSVLLMALVLCGLIFSFIRARISSSSDSIFLTIYPDIKGEIRIIESKAKSSGNHGTSSSPIIVDKKVIEIDDIGIFSDWHKLEAKTKEGNVEVKYQIESGDISEFRLFEAGSDDSGAITLFLGSVSELYEWRKKHER